MKNRHPIDRLAEVREEIAALKTEETELRELILGRHLVEGDEHVASLTEQIRKTLDRKSLERAFGKAAVAKHENASGFTVIRLIKKSVAKPISLFD